MSRLYRSNPAAINQTAPVARTGYSWCMLVNLDSAPAPESEPESIELPEDLPPGVREIIEQDRLEREQEEAETPILVEPTEFLHFYFNPAAIALSREAAYDQGAIVGANVQPLQWTGTAGSIMRLDNLILDSNDETKTIQPWINQIQSYLTAIPALGRPAHLAFVFGEKRYAPCVLESVDIVETAWVNGLPVRATASLVLRKQATPEDLPALPPDIELVPESTLSGQIQTPTNQTNADGSAVGSTSPPVTGDYEATIKEATVYIEGCTGYIVSANQVCTAYHCISGVGDRKTITLSDGTEVEGEVIAGTQSDDTAILQVVGHTFTTFAPLGNSDNVKVGDKVAAYGFPGGDPEEERTEGTVTKNPSQENGFPTISYTKDFLYPGQSGGPNFAITGSETGKVISQTQGGAGADRSGAKKASDMSGYECWGVRINTVKQEFNLS